MMDALYRPLGMNAPRRGTRRFAPGGSTLAGTLAVAATLAASAATSLTQPAFRHVDVFAEDARRAAQNEAAQTAMPAADVAVITGAPLKPLGRSSAPAALADNDAPTVSYPPGAAADYGKQVLVRDPAAMRQAPADAAMPDDALVEPSDAGPLPVRAADGRRPFDVYGVAPSADLGTRIAIVVGGLGISQTGTMRAIEQLPAAVTLAFAPEGNSLDRWMKAARVGGHELLLQVPMEPVGYPTVSPGAHTLTLDDAAGGRFDALRWSLGRLTNYVGVMNYMGARLTADPAAMRSFSTELTRRGLMYFDDGTSARSLARDAARESGGPFAAADVLLDADQDPDAIAKRLDTLERAARAGGRAVGVASAFDASVGAIATWIRQAEKRGIAVVPVSALADDPESQ